MSNTESAGTTTNSKSTSAHQMAKGQNNKRSRVHEIKAELKAKALKEGVTTADPGRSFANWNRDQTTRAPKA